MRLVELFFIVAVTLWLFTLPVYFLLIRFTLDVNLRARNKTKSLRGNRRSC